MPVEQNILRTFPLLTETQKMLFFYNTRLKLKNSELSSNKSSLFLKTNNLTHLKNKIKESQNNMKNKRISSCPRLTIFRNNSFLHLLKFLNLLLKRGKKDNKNWPLWNKIIKTLKSKLNKWEFYLLS